MDLRDTLVRAIRDVDGLGRSWALIGGLAVSTRAEPRLTRDVDIAMAVEDDPEAEQVVRELRYWRAMTETVPWTTTIWCP